MKKLMSLVLVVVLVASVSFAGEKMKPELIVEKMMSCAACAPMQKYPKLMPNIRSDTFETSTGFVSTFVIADESLMGDYAKCDKECAAIRETAMTWSPAMQKEKLCHVCSGMAALMKRDDVTVESFNIAMGTLTVASATTDAGRSALHEQAKVAKMATKAMKEASAKMMKEGGGY